MTYDEWHSHTKGDRSSLDRDALECLTQFLRYEF